MLRSLRYVTPYFLYVLAYLAFTKAGIYCWLPLVYLFFFIPIVELLISPDESNLTEEEEHKAKSTIFFDLVLWLTVPLQIAALYLFLTTLDQSRPLLDTLGRVMAMGLLCGTFGINAAHELGHRISKLEQFFAKTLLLTSLYMHFFIEHNKGHHKHVATSEDPSTAFYNQNLYAFWIQTFVGTQKKAWQIARKEAGHSLFNEMAMFQLIQFTSVGVVYYFFGGFVLCVKNLLQAHNHAGQTRKNGRTLCAGGAAAKRCDGNVRKRTAAYADIGRVQGDPRVLRLP
jgi:alkane 1-monooxygenase